MPAPTQPSASLLANLRSEWMRYPPFTQMQPTHVDEFLAKAQLAYYAPGETLLAPADGAPSSLFCIRQGHVTGHIGAATETSVFGYGAGDLFPVGALIGGRPVVATYKAHDDVFCLLLKAEAVQRLAGLSPEFSRFLGQRALHYLAQARQTRPADFAGPALEEQSLETPLAQLGLRAPVAVAPGTPLVQALETMRDKRIGSILVADAKGAALGILTRHDILERVTLARADLDGPIDAVMTTPVHTLTVHESAQDAAILMARHGIRHVPVTRDGVLAGMVSERDLFAMQRLSLKNVSSALRGARDVSAMVLAAADIWRFARTLLDQGVAARQLTQLISHLNDVLTERLVTLIAAETGVDMARACWLAFGSEGRNEQTIATDQDNGLVFMSDDAVSDRPRWLAFAQRVNTALDQCGYPLCKGNIMASNPQCCLSVQEWRERFSAWMEHGAPQDLLNASIYFDLRPLVGNHGLTTELMDLIAERAQALPRFIQQMALNSLRNRAPLNWLGNLETQEVAGRAMLDLKHHGTAIFVDVARLYALARGVRAFSTRERFEALGAVLKVAPQESQAWIAAFEYLQMLRLQVQLQHAVAPEQANLLELGKLNDIDQRMLKESMRVARRLQQKLELDYPR